MNAPVLQRGRSLETDGTSGHPASASPRGRTPVATVTCNLSGRWLCGLRGNWPDAASRLLAQGEHAVVRVVVVEIRGSAPREPGACMLVSSNGLQGTIGGGNLEWSAARAAHSLLPADAATPSVRVQRLVLAKELGQCCGGVVQLWLERFTRADLPLLRRAAEVVSRRGSALITTELAEGRVTRYLNSPLQSREPGTQPRLVFSATEDGNAHLFERVESSATPLWLYGAGHVGQALIRLVSDLPFETTWIDSRAELLPQDLPDNVRPLLTPDPVATVATAPADARFLVMTHDHALDYALCREILSRGSFAWLGLIGSKSKGARFRSRLARDGIAREDIERLVCPIGVTGITSKWPSAIAVAVAAQLLQSVDSRKTEHVAAPAEICSSPDCAGCASARGHHG